MTAIRVTNVKGLQGEARAGVCYVGREFAGWPASPWGNPFRPAAGVDAVAAYREWFLGRPTADVHRALADLWEACGQGAKPLGCWCVDAVHGDGQPAVYHAQVLAELLTEWLGREAPPPDTWKPNPCGCRACNICGFYGLAAKPPPPPPPPPAPKLERGPAPRTPTLFDEVPA